MNFHALSLAGAFRVEPVLHSDARGFFARSFCQQEFAEHGLDSRCTQCNISYNEKAGTLRGMHFQRPPHMEAKLVRCTAGAIFDVIVDLRPTSTTYGEHVSAELTSDNRHMLYVPEGFAHGFLTLTDDAEVFYQMSSAFVPGSGAGLRYDDQQLGIAWPGPAKVISDQDLAHPAFDPDSFAAALRSEMVAT